MSIESTAAKRVQDFGGMVTRAELKEVELREIDKSDFRLMEEKHGRPGLVSFRPCFGEGCEEKKPRSER